MHSLKYNRKRIVFLALCVAAVAGCTDKLENAIDDANTDDIDGVTGGLAKQCGLSCPDDGVLEGNASISGIAAVDGFFAAVVNYQTTADHVCGGIEGQLQAIKADFGYAADANLAASLDADIALYVDGGVTLQTDPPKCVTDVQTVVRAEAKCDVEVNPGEAMVACKGSCEVEASASASCDANAELKCTATSPSIACEGDCQGTCTAQLTAAAKCVGTCRGTCSDDCSAYTKNADGDFECAGSCEGTCKGSCSTELAAAAECKGTCDGTCTVTNPEAGCEGSLKAECQAMANTMVMCSGKCEGEFEPPTAKAECSASAQAEAKISVECTPPRLAMHYQLAAVASAKLDAQARFVVALENLKLRMPALLAQVEKAKSVASAGEILTASASGAVKVSLDKAKTGKISVKETIGLVCAIKELGHVGEAITTPEERLMVDLMASTDLQLSLGLDG